MRFEFLCVSFFYSNYWALLLFIPKQTSAAGISEERTGNEKRYQLNNYCVLEMAVKSSEVIINKTLQVITITRLQYCSFH